MAERLPVVGGDAAAWGTILNGFLGVSLNPDGTLKLVVSVKTNDYILALADIDTVVEMNKASAINLTVPPNSSVAIPVGTIIEVFQVGVGQVTIAPGSGVTIRSPGGKLKLSGQYSSASLRKRGTDEWVVCGDVTT